MNEDTTPKERQDALRIELIKGGWRILRDDFDIPYIVKHKVTGKEIPFSKIQNFYLLLDRLPEP